MDNRNSSKVLRHSLRRMTLHTEVLINAKARPIWETLIDFRAYQEWNTSIPLVRGEARAGTYLHVTIQWPGLRRSSYKLQVLVSTPERELRWLGHLGPSGLMDGDHSFVIEPTEDGACRVTQKEHFNGWLVPFFSPWLRKNILSGFEKMNAELKSRVEQLPANGRTPSVSAMNGSENYSPQAHSEK